MVVSEGFMSSQNKVAPTVSEAVIIRVIGTSKILKLLFTMCCLTRVWGMFLRKNVRR